MLRASISSPLRTYRLTRTRERLDPAEPVAPEKPAVADEMKRTIRRVVAVAQHGQDKLVIGQGFIDKAPCPPH